MYLTCGSVKVFYIIFGEEMSYYFYYFNYNYRGTYFYRHESSCAYFCLYYIPPQHL